MSAKWPKSSLQHHIWRIKEKEESKKMKKTSFLYLIYFLE